MDDLLSNVDAKSTIAIPAHLTVLLSQQLEEHFFDFVDLGLNRLTDDGDDATMDQIRKRAKWDSVALFCRGLSSKVMPDPLIDYLANWLNLEKNYGIPWRPNIWLWMHQTGHVHFKRMKDMSKDGLILAFDLDTKNDLCDLHAIPSLGNKKYFVTFIDDASRFCYVYLLHTKDEALDKFKLFKTEVELQQESLIKRFRTDRGGEYIDTMYFQSVGIIHEMTAPYTPQQNGISKRKNRYAENSKTFRFYVIEPNELVLINSIIESKDAIFDENRFSLVPRPSLRIPNGTKDIGGSVVPKEFNVKDDPKTFDEAMKSHDVAFWKEAINDEIDSIMGNNTWVLADLPPGCKPLCYKWIFKRKLKVDETIEKFKDRLVIQGFRQKSGLDYLDTHALVARISTIRLLITLASIHSLIIHQMDVKTTFLNGELDEEVAMTKEFLSSRFSMKDMGEADVILGIRIKHESNRIAISQYHYIEKVLKKFNYFDCTLVSTHMDTSEKLMPNNGQAVSQLEYYRVIGCPIYAMTCTRSDIAFVVGKLSRYTSNPGTQHLQAIQRVLKYLKKTIDYSLTYIVYPLVLEGYTDARWISNTEDNLSTSGWVFQLGGGAISRAFKKQTCITSSIMEFEFVALATTGKEAEWLRNLILDISLWSKPIAPISILCDSAATLAKAYSQMYNGKSRHLGVRHSIIRELIMNGVISIENVRSQQNLANHLTKGLARDLVIKSVEGWV
ncbi:zinc finger, CCHC-type containing protein [Tanacetum coccineum]